jgi:hypothetical protein
MREAFMICPKCGKKMQLIKEFSAPSSLCRQDGSGCHEWCEFYRCWNCSTRRYVNQEPVMAIDVKALEITKRRYNPAVKTAAHHIVVKFYKSISDQRQGGASWYAIAHLLSQAGHRCQEKTLQKHFLLEHDKRVMGNEAQT